MRNILAAIMNYVLVAIGIGLLVFAMRWFGVISEEAKLVGFGVGIGFGMGLLVQTLVRGRTGGA